MERLTKLINLVVSHTFFIGSLINFPLETSSLSFYPVAMSKPVLLTLLGRDILKDMEWEQSTKHRQVGEETSWKGPAPWGPARGAGHRRGPWAVSA